jgi:hypothetical protein
MGSFLLSIASAETISWIGFAVLGLALVGEVGVILSPPRWEKLHKELAFGFAVLASGGYAVERVGDDAIIKALEKRATSAEAGLKVVTSARVITPDQHAKIVLCLKDGPKGTLALKPGLLDQDAQPLADGIGKILDEADGFPRADQKDDALKWQTPGIFLVVKDLKNAPAQAVTIQKCFTAVGIEMFGYADPTYTPDAVTIGIGPRT